ncbi:hypothetical protein [Streptomyces sp. NPDC018031]|uniref:hypothetical protein n=1 Tax=Streptomyces sp. NPDC018031 TaxID=3365033 RepID=UPI003797D32A
MTSDQTKRGETATEREEHAVRDGELGSLEVWARSAPIRLAGYEEDLAEPHILQGVD